MGEVHLAIVNISDYTVNPPLHISRNSDFHKQAGFLPPATCPTYQSCASGPRMGGYIQGDAPGAPLDS